MKTLFLSLLCVLSAIASHALPNEKVLRNFNLAFPKADSVIWSESETEYGVYFINNGIKCRIWYDLDGNAKRCFRCYTEEKLPPMIAGNIHHKYPNAKVFGITEKSTPEEFTYEVVLETDKHWISVNADAIGNLKTIKKMNKAAGN